MKYDAFISYRHLEKDMFVAKAVHKELETTKIPWKIKKETGKKRINRVFRDQEELPIGSDLGENIEAALKESEHLVVICSPQTKESLWVMKEIDTFIALHGRDNVLAVLVDGEPGDSFPPQLLTDENGNSVEPLAADVRGSSKREIKKKIKSEGLRLAAAIIGCDYDDLKQRHRERIVKRYVLIAAIAAVLGISFGVYNAYNLARINENYQQKLINESRVLAATSGQALQTGDRKTAALIAMEGLPSEDNDRPFVADCQYALSEALDSYDIGDIYHHEKVLTHNLEVEDIACNEDGTRLLTFDKSNFLYYWDVDTEELLFHKPVNYANNLYNATENIYEIAVFEDMPVVVTTDTLTAYDSEGAEQYQVEFGEFAIINDVCFSTKNRVVAISFYGKIEIYNVDDGTLIKTFEAPEGRKYITDISFNTDGTRIAYETVDGEGISMVDVVTLETGERLEIPEGENLNMDYAFTMDDGIAICKLPGEAMIYNQVGPMAIHKVDLGSGEEIFSTEIEYVGTANNLSNIQIRSRSIEYLGEARNELLVSACNALYALDLNTGEQLYRYNSNYPIQNYAYSSQSELVLITTFDGVLRYIGTVSNSYSMDVRNEFLVEISDSVIKLVSGGDRIIACGYKSPDVVIINRAGDASKEKIYEFEESLLEEVFAKSPDEKTFLSAREVSAVTGDTNYYMFSSDTLELIGQVSLKENKYGEDPFYLDNDTIVIPLGFSGVMYYSLYDGRKEEINFREDGTALFKIVYSDNKKYVTMNYERSLYVFDLMARKMKYNVEVFEQGEEDAEFRQYAISSDGNTCFVINGNYDVLKVNCVTGQVAPVSSSQKITGINFSNDDKLLFMTGVEGTLEVRDAGSLEILDEIEFYGSGDSLVKDSLDNTKLYLCGDDHYFRIYDLEAKEFLYTLDNQIIATEVEESEGTNVLVIHSSSNNSMYLLDKDSYGLLGKAHYGVVYLGEQKTLISCKRKNMYKFDIKTLDELISEAKERFKDAKLTDEQKRKYKIG